MKPNPLLQEIYDYRAEHAKKFDYDLGRIFADARARQARSGVRVVDRTMMAKRRGKKSSV